MAGGRAIKARIKTTKSIQQITKAMEAVSAVKMRRSEAVALKSRAYALYALQILNKINSSLSEFTSFSPLFDTREIKKKTLVVVSSDKGLAGSFNSNVLRKAKELFDEKKYDEVVTIGKRAKEFFERKGAHSIRHFEGVGDYVALDEIEPIAEFVMNHFLEKNTDIVDVVYTNFVSALKQEVVVRPLLPLNTTVLEEVVKNIIPETGKYADFRGIDADNIAEYKFEPDPETILKELVPNLVKIEVYHSILEANASEHAARMVAMKNASTNAKEMIGTLTIKYNKERQAQITKELIEIVSGKEALSSQLEE